MVNVEEVGLDLLLPFGVFLIGQQNQFGVGGGDQGVNLVLGIPIGLDVLLDPN